MKRFSNLCIALSAAVLLTGGLAGQAQAQDTGAQQIGRLSKAGTYTQAEARVSGADYETARITAFLDFNRDGSESNAARWITLIITPPGAGNHEGQGQITIRNLYVRPDGIFKKNLEDGSRISGRIETDFVASAFDGAMNVVSGNYRTADGMRVDFETDQFKRKGIRTAACFPNCSQDQKPSLMSYLMHFESWDYRDGRSGRIWNPGETNTYEHLQRGTAVQFPEGEGEGSEGLSADLRLYTDLVGNPEMAREETRVGCRGGSCAARGTTLFEAGHFLANDDPSQARTILDHLDIGLALDKSGDDGIGSALSFGAWMNHAGFFVATDGTMRIGSRDRAARMVVAAGRPTGSRPTASATWRGSMVGTPKEGEYRNNILRGEAQLRFNVVISMLDARFFNIKDFTRFGSPHKMEEVAKGRQSRLRIKGIPVAANGSYALTFDDASGGSIRGAFYGDGQAETAGTFDRFGIIAAFGATRTDLISQSASDEEVGNQIGEFVPESERPVYESDGRITINGVDTGKRWH